MRSARAATARTATSRAPPPARSAATSCTSPAAATATWYSLRSDSCVPIQCICAFFAWVHVVISLFQQMMVNTEHRMNIVHTIFISRCCFLPTPDNTIFIFWCSLSSFSQMHLFKRHNRKSISPSLSSLADCLPALPPCPAVHTA